MTTSKRNLTKSPAYRVLWVMDMIGAHGPINLNGLCARLPDISRAGIWRATAVLRAYGWVRMRLADNAFELTSKMDCTLANAHFANPYVEDAVRGIEDLLSDGAKDVDAGTFTAPGRFEIIESTRHDASLGKPLSLVFDDFALGAQSHLNQVDLLRHLSAFVREATQDERDMIETGNHLKTLQNRMFRRTRKAGDVYLRILAECSGLRNTSYRLSK